MLRPQKQNQPGIKEAPVQLNWTITGFKLVGFLLQNNSEKKTRNDRQRYALPGKADCRTENDRRIKKNEQKWGILDPAANIEVSLNSISEFPALEGVNIESCKCLLSFFWTV